MFRFKKLDVFIARQFSLLFIGTFFICQFVLMMQFLWARVDDLIGKGLSMDVLAQFFWYMGLMLLPQALPLAILLSSLITFGNLGESSELTAIKAAGVSLMQAFRSLIVISVLVCFVSIFFQNYVAPSANRHLAQILMSLKQKSPELEIPEGVFYDGIPNSNLYVQRKDVNTGKLYGIMIYRMTGSYEDQAIILADSGMLQATADKKHLKLTLWRGEWFENMRSQEVSRSAAVPYRRETFAHKQILLDYDGDFNMADASMFSNDARAKSFAKIRHDMDSIALEYDSIGRVIYAEEMSGMRAMQSSVSEKDSLVAVKRASGVAYNVDSVYAHLPSDQKKTLLNAAMNRVQSKAGDLDFKSLLTNDGDRLIRQHRIEIINKISLALSCLIFFFIGAPLGAIIRKGGLGVPVLISVLVYIAYYILDNSGYRMARGGMWTVWFGKSLAPAVLVPLAVFFTYKAINDSVVFNVELYRGLLMKFLGLRSKRHVFMKEVIINDPDYAADRQKLEIINGELEAYSQQHNLKHAPNWLNVFFRYEPDHDIERISDEMEAIVEDLSNSKDRQVIGLLNAMPVLATKAHTRPFERQWLNVVAAVAVPVGLFLYFRMWSFRIRLLRDLRDLREANAGIIARIGECHAG
ncbi:MAG: LptF/LptG family permease [Prevotella sp.]